MPRLRRVISRTLSLARLRLLGQSPVVRPEGAGTPQELPLYHWSYRALLTVYAQTEPPFLEGRHRGHHPLASCLRPHVDITVVGIPAEAVSSPFQLPVQLI